VSDSSRRSLVSAPLKTRRQVLFLSYEISFGRDAGSANEALQNGPWLMNISQILLDTICVPSGSNVTDAFGYPRLRNLNEKQDNSNIEHQSACGPSTRSTTNRNGRKQNLDSEQNSKIDLTTTRGGRRTPCVPPPCPSALLSLIQLTFRCERTKRTKCAVSLATS